MQTAVQLTFSFEIVSLQLTPTFKMGALQLKPTSKIVTMRLAPSQQPQPAMNLQVTFEISNVQAAGGGIGQIRLTPSQQQRPGVVTSPAFNIAGLQLLSGSESGAVQLTPSQQGQASVHVTGWFQIATVEFSPSFEIASLVLNATSKSVSVQLPGAGPTAVQRAPLFEIASVEVGAAGIELLQLVAPASKGTVSTVFQPTPIRPPVTVTPIQAQPRVVVTTMEKAGYDLAPFVAVLAQAGVPSAKPVLSPVEVSVTLPNVITIEEFVDQAVAGSLAISLDVTRWIVGRMEEVDRCVFLAKYRSGAIRPVTATVEHKDGTVLLKLTDPISFFDRDSAAQAFPTAGLAGSFDLTAFYLPDDA
jgi:hypothetical protein